MLSTPRSMYPTTFPGWTLRSGGGFELEKQGHHYHELLKKLLLSRVRETVLTQSPAGDRKLINFSIRASLRGVDR